MWVNLEEEVNQEFSSLWVNAVFDRWSDSSSFGYRYDSHDYYQRNKESCLAYQRIHQSKPEVKERRRVAKNRRYRDRLATDQVFREKEALRKRAHRRKLAQGSICSKNS